MKFGDCPIVIGTAWIVWLNETQHSVLVDEAHSGRPVPHRSYDAS
jgi:hypothetical protein